VVKETKRRGRTPVARAAWALDGVEGGDWMGEGDDEVRGQIRGFIAGRRMRRGLRRGLRDVLEAKRQYGSVGAASWAGATISPKKAKRKMVVTLRQPIKTVRPVPAW
jgi:hypothetical protein